MKMQLMIARIFVILSLVIGAQNVYGQETPSQIEGRKMMSDVSALEPIDKQPYLFKTKDELDSESRIEIKKIRENILGGGLTYLEVLKLREKIWRYENARLYNKEDNK
ncbi:MAG: hypothetical protein HRT57_08285 [Crocinitomicaceae bacterium]|nr:hypothetical protein [Crocinitomicaceae bacterium]